MFEIEPEVLESVSQLTRMWEKLMEDVGGIASDETGLAIRWADAGFGFYNALVATEPIVREDQLGQVLLRSVDFMNHRTQSGSLWIFGELVSPEIRPLISDLACEAGLVPSLTCWGMAGDVSLTETSNHPALRFERVTSQEHLDLYASLNARAYGVSEAGAQAAFRGSNLWRNEIFAFLAFEGSKPVACAGACVVDGRIFTIMVATEPTAQRRGYGEAVTRRALLEANQASGISRVCLQATAAGKPVYEKIGLRANSVVQLFSRAVDK